MVWPIMLITSIFVPFGAKGIGQPFSSYRPAPLIERTGPEGTVMLSTNQVPSKIKQITNSGMRTVRNE